MMRRERAVGGGRHTVDAEGEVHASDVVGGPVVELPGQEAVEGVGGHAGGAA